ncbi:hepatic lectin-like, partial [Neopelma chrysocephalum]|uniref:hepatic lectin-like n=1 Tax=Neopelma chrysocephalum TaxID=114329 RepID=UPI000FCCF783
MDEEHLDDDLRVFKGRSLLPRWLHSFLPVYVLLGLSFLLSVSLCALSLSRVSAISSKLHEVNPERGQNFSNRDSLLFPCGPDSREWEYFLGNCYYFSLGRASWFRAKAQCEELGSHLAVIDSFAEQVIPNPHPAGNSRRESSPRALPALRRQGAAGNRGQGGFFGMRLDRG